MIRFSNLLQIYVLINLLMLLCVGNSGADDSGVEIATLRGHTNDIMSIAFSPDGQILASGSADNTIKLWNLVNREVIATLDTHVGLISSVAFSPDGHLLASGSRDNMVKLWDVSRQTEIMTFRGHGDYITCVKFNPDGRILASSSWDGTVKFWNVEKLREITSLEGHEGSVYGIAFSPDGRLLASSGRDYTVRLWDVVKRRELEIIQERGAIVKCVAFSPDGRLLAGGSHNGMIQLWDMSQRKEMAALNEHGGIVNSIFFSPDSRLLAAGSYGTNVKLWDVSDSENIVTLQGDDEDWAYTVAFSPDGSLLASGNTDYTIKLWDMMGKDNVVAHEKHTPPSYPPRLEGQLKFREPSGNKLLDAGEEGTIEVSLANKGRGTAYGLSVSIEPELTYRQLQIKRPRRVTKLSPSQNITIQIPVSAGANIAAQEIALTVSVSEVNGFDLVPPLKIRFRTQRSHPPQLEVTDYAIEDFNNNRKIERAEIVKITARIQNRGSGEGQNARAVVSVGENVFITPDSKTTFNLGNLAPGEYTDIQFEMFTNNKATNLPVTIKLTESHAKYGAVEELDLPFAVVQKLPQELVVEGTPTQMKIVGNAPELVSDIDRNIPKTLKANRDAVAVVIGNSRYSDNDIPSVEFAAHDAAIMKEYLINTFGYRESNILFYTNADLREFNTIFGKDGRPWGRLYDYMKPGVSDVFVYYSGHGAPDPDSKQAYLLPVDCIPDNISLTGYNRRTLIDNLAQLPARSVTVVLDACFSGSSHAGSLMGDISPAFIPIDPMNKLSNGTIFVSSAAEQVSTWYRDKKHGLFTYFFLKGLRGIADTNADDKITVGELEGYITDPADGVPYWSRRLKSREQTPAVIGHDKKKVMVELK